MKKTKRKAKGKKLKLHWIDVRVGKRIKELRLLREMTQRELGEQIGVRFQQVQKYETGINRVSASRLFVIAKALHVGVEELFEGWLKNGGIQRAKR